MRYVLPIFPFAFVWASQVARAVPSKQWKTAALGAVALAWSVGSSLWVVPHSLSYFNESVGGPAGGHAHLIHSNIDWGQDLLYLKRWSAVLAAISSRSSRSPGRDIRSTSTRFRRPIPPATPIK